jgi:hypothetical protein
MARFVRIAARLAKRRQTVPPLWIQVRGYSTLLVILGLVSGLAPLWIRELITIFPGLIVMESVALILGLFGIFGLSVAGHVRKGATSGNRFERVFVKLFLLANDDAMGKTGQEFWTNIRVKNR